MNFFEKVYKIYTGTYNVNTNSAANPYFGTATNMTKDQLVSFNAQLQTMGLNKPAGIDNIISDFTTVDSNNNGVLSQAEVNTYLINKGLMTNTNYYNGYNNNYNNYNSTNLISSTVTSLSSVIMGLKNLV